MSAGRVPCSRRHDVAFSKHPPGSAERASEVSGNWRFCRGGKNVAETTTSFPRACNWKVAPPGGDGGNDGTREITVFQILKCCCSSRLLYYIHPVNVSKMKGNSLSNSHSAHLNPHCELNWTVQEAGGRTFKTLFPAKFNRAIVFPTHYLVIHMNHLLVKSKFRFFMNAVYIWNIMNSCPKNTHTRNT